MLHSMTAFARRSEEAEWGSASWEIRSVNHRYLEVSVRMPDILRDIEIEVREKLRKKLQRGKIECFLKYQPQSATHQMALNQPLIEQLSEASKSIESLFPRSQVNMMDLLAWPGVLSIQETDIKTLQKIILKLFDQALNDLTLMRQQEGQTLGEIIQQRLASVLKEIEKVKERLPVIIENQRNKIRIKIEEAALVVNAERFEQEMILFLQRIDVAEELDRLNIHVQEVYRILEEGGGVGRRLDFLMQELNREANTLGSKSTDTQTTAVSVELKVLIEQMREQIQNIE